MPWFNDCNSNCICVCSVAINIIHPYIYHYCIRVHNTIPRVINELGAFPVLLRVVGAFPVLFAMSEFTPRDARWEGRVKGRKRWAWRVARRDSRHHPDSPKGEGKGGGGREGEKAGC